MLGEKVRNFKTHANVSIEDLVPVDNFYRQLDAKLDLSFVHELVRECYCPFGRPSIDPIVFFKLQLIMFFEGIRSERQLMKHIHLNLSFRWYISYDLDEPVPHHSSLTRIRERFGWTIFQRFFDEIVQRCIEVGLVWGQELHFDGNMILAKANFDNQVPRFYHQAQKHLGEVFDKPDCHPERQVWIEPKFAELKQWHLGIRYRLRGLFNVNIEALIKATGQNIKQLIKAKRQPDSPKTPATAAMLVVSGAFLLTSLESYGRDVIYSNVFFNALVRFSDNYTLLKVTDMMTRIIIQERVLGNSKETTSHPCLLKSFHNRSRHREEHSQACQ